MRRTNSIAMKVAASAAVWFGAAITAQAASFCPATVTQQNVVQTRQVCVTRDSFGNCTEFRTETFVAPATFSGFSAQPVNGQCTNNGQGPDPAAFSGAALASQALSELSQSTTQETARSAENSITNRRDEERERCSAGFSRVNGACEPIAAPAAEQVAPPPPSPAPAKKHAAKKKGKAAVAEVEEAPPPRSAPPRAHPKATFVSKDGFVPPPPPLEAPFRYSVWGQVFGEYEKRNASGFGAISGPDFNGGAPVGVNTTVDSKTGTVGFQAGLDYTAHGLFAPTDGVIVGALVGYISSTLNLDTVSASSNPAIVGTGTTHLHAKLDGPSLGVYGTYFSGPFSADILAKFDLLSLDQNFTDNLAFAGPFGPFSSTFSGQGSASLLNSTVAGNLNYRFDVYPNFWFEPTVGAQFTALGYGGGAAALGLENGNQVMVQGGARVGTASVFDKVIIKTTLTGLAYSDVAVNGGFIPGASFNGNNILADADRGQVRGRGILAFNLDFGQGLTSFVLGDVHGGQGLFGAGGRAGIRYQW
ncbi:conserved hypothetical protein [Methylocella silvestris BL2]|uniref:Autotransporter domain-containing protein n=1 Tax=Methylocella silvestris (strain DSM 15510 / CIP 108128 / LMG 27833 / NCIMB 13906 / BL2) TaxID=395965 RepID=B8EIJ2_METSB|nr:autotransporter outer membrane beta-barrel domain-containing protein [Methylocella silvestris]ACK51311.1 conserved hypothetical protein [Methylocella silvestris BL2]